MRGGAVIPALTVLALALVVGQAVIIRRVIEQSEELIAASETAGLMCRSCGRALRPGILSPYPRPCVCRRSRHVRI